MNWLDELEDELEELSEYQIERRFSSSQMAEQIRECYSFVTDPVEEVRSYVLESEGERVFVSTELGRKDGYPVIGFSAEIDRIDQQEEVEEVFPIESERYLENDTIPAL